MFGFEGTEETRDFFGRIFDSPQDFQMVIKAQWLSWLERRPVTAKVVGSSPIWVVSRKRSDKSKLGS